MTDPQDWTLTRHDQLLLHALDWIVNTRTPDPAELEAVLAIVRETVGNQANRSHPMIGPLVIEADAFLDQAPWQAVKTMPGAWCGITHRLQLHLQRFHLWRIGQFRDRILAEVVE